MIKFELDDLKRLQNQVEKNPIILTKAEYYNLAYHVKRAIRKSGLCIRKEKICKGKSVKSDYLLFPVNLIYIKMDSQISAIVDFIFLSFEKVDKDKYECISAMIKSKHHNPLSCCSISINAYDPKELKNISNLLCGKLKFKEMEFRKLTDNLLIEFLPYIQYETISNNIGWIKSGNNFYYNPIKYPTINPDTPYKELNNAIKAVRRSAFLRVDNTDYLADDIINNFLTVKINYLSESDLLLFTVTLFSFCQRFFNNIEQNPFSIYINSSLGNTKVRYWVSFWIDLFNPYDFQDKYNNLADPVYSADKNTTTKSNKRKLINEAPTSYVQLNSMNYISPVKFHEIETINRDHIKDCPVLIYDITGRIRNCKKYLEGSRKEYIKNSNRLPVIIKPNTSDYLPDDDHFIIITILESVINSHMHSYETSRLKEFLLFTYRHFIGYLNSNSELLNKTLSLYYKRAIKEIIPRNSEISIQKRDQYAYLYATLLLFQESLSSSNDKYVRKGIITIIEKAKDIFINQISIVPDTPQIISDQKKCLTLFNNFINSSIDTVIININVDSLTKEIIGWFESSPISTIYCMPQYFSLFQKYCLTSGYTLPYTQKSFEKYVLRNTDILIPQYIPSNPNIKPRYDVYRKINGQKIKTHCIDIIKLNSLL
jgi:hypothetical protein